MKNLIKLLRYYFKYFYVVFSMNVEGYATSHYYINNGLKKNHCFLCDQEYSTKHKCKLAKDNDKQDHTIILAYFVEQLGASKEFISIEYPDILVFMEDYFRFKFDKTINPDTITKNPFLSENMNNVLHIDDIKKFTLYIKEQNPQKRVIELILPYDNEIYNYKDIILYVNSFE